MLQWVTKIQVPFFVFFKKLWSVWCDGKFYSRTAGVVIRIICFARLSNGYWQILLAHWFYCALQKFYHKEWPKLNNIPTESSYKMCFFIGCDVKHYSVYLKVISNRIKKPTKSSNLFSKTFYPFAWVGKFKFNEIMSLHHENWDMSIMQLNEHWFLNILINIFET